MDKYLTVDEMRAIEREANESGLSYREMMLNAGKGIADRINIAYSHLSNKSIIAIVGSGNNGGDALVALCHLIKAQWSTTAYLISRKNTNEDLIVKLSRLGGEVIYADDKDVRLLDLLEGKSILLDGVLGTGVRLPLSPDVSRVLSDVKRYIFENPGKIIVVAVDCPSGINCDTGESPMETIPADMTVTMAGVKQGLLKFPAADLTGEIKVAGIGNLEGIRRWNSINRYVLTDDGDVKKLMPLRPRNSHKGTFGTSLLIGGSVQYPGAMLLAAEAAYHIGAGLVTCAIPELIHLSLIGRLPEATWIRLSHKDGWISREAASDVFGALPRIDALLVGPGIGVQKETSEFIIDILPLVTMKCVFDADGIKLLAGILNWDRILGQEVVLTPHPGEMAILTGLSVAEIQSKRIEIAEQYSQKWNKVVVLKGAFTIIAAPNQSTLVLPVATSALAHAGTGDVLAGLITGLLSQGLNCYHAAIAGSWIHAYAGIDAEKSLGCSNSVLARDIVQSIPRVVRRLY
jgi:NAD(P)H-hydrate epimerase